MKIELKHVTQIHWNPGELIIKYDVEKEGESVCFDMSMDEKREERNTEVIGGFVPYHLHRF